MRNLLTKVLIPILVTTSLLGCAAGNRNTSQESSLIKMGKTTWEYFYKNKANKEDLIEILDKFYGNQNGKVEREEIEKLVESLKSTSPWAADYLTGNKDGITTKKEMVNLLTWVKNYEQYFSKN